MQGFKLPASVTLTNTQTAEAHVGLLQSAVYAFEPFNVSQPEVVVPTNGGTFTVTLDEGPLTVGLYAKFGVADNSTTPPTFTPYLLGVLRNLSVSPGNPVSQRQHHPRHPPRSERADHAVEHALAARPPTRRH